MPVIIDFLFMQFPERTNFSQNEITTKVDTLSLLNGTKINHHDKT